MATDKSEPKVGMIAKIAVLCIATLIGVHEGLVAYFDHVAQAEEYRKVGSAKPEALLNAREDEKQRLETGSMPIEKAMQVVMKGRTASPDIAPSVSKDTAPLQGWSKLPLNVPAAMMAPEPAPAPSASDSAAPAASAAPSSPPAASASAAPRAPAPKASGAAAPKAPGGAAPKPAAPKPQK
jgi:hypothetical protein